MTPRGHTLDACFPGPYGENDTLLERLLVEFLRDHVYWRRNVHPEDPPAIATAAAQPRTTWRSKRACAASCTSSPPR
ncbi:hypothetical protein [Fulvimonas yonginensis]|uniref:Uncharacterized protein n=1 Tax=Fulvimonas yonginensis TaxID=1495200 RepID=A0ABU8JG09_9GAMM